MTTSTIAILHPGEMGASVAAAAAGNGHRVLWVEDGRSTATRARAGSAGLEAGGDLTSVLAQASVVLSVCPPHAAEAVAREVADANFQGLFLDANAVSPATADRVCRAVRSAGAEYVDGGIIGPPARLPGITRLYLSGPQAARIAALFEGSALEPRMLGAEAFAASALKMAYAAWTKGSTALLANVQALARARGVGEALLEEWALSQPGLEQRARDAVTGSAFKAWRWVAEMHEIGDSFAGAGLPDGFHRGAAEVYQRLSAFKDCQPEPELEAVIAALLADASGVDGC